MYLILLALHSWGRWAVLAGLLFGLGRAYRGWLSGGPFTPFDDTIRHSVATVAHLQLTLGYLLYFTSPLVRSFRLRNAEHDPGALFFGLQHVMAMTVAVVILTIGAALAKRRATDPAKFRTMALWFTAALLLIFSGNSLALLALGQPALLPSVTMLKLFNSPLGRLRLLGLAEGLSLLLLVGVAVPLKHLYGDASLVRILGPAHGLLFLLYLLNTLRVGVEQKWHFAHTTWKVLLASVVPFGTFFVERKILAPLQQQS